MKTFFALLIPLLLQQSSNLTGAKPVSKGAWWEKRHEEYVAEAKKGGIDVVFLGDSITDRWRDKPQDQIWKKRFAPLRAANFGIAGDATQHVLWRVQHGTLDGIQPRVVCLLVGINNLARPGPDGTQGPIAGIELIVKEIRTRLPKTKILLQAVFPYKQKADDPVRAQIKELNAAIAKMDDGGKTVKFVDFGAKFLEPDGSISERVMPDFLHLSPKGYDIWADEIQLPLARLLKP